MAVLLLLASTTQSVWAQTSCTQDSQCSDPSNLCVSSTCVNGTCQTTPTVDCSASKGPCYAPGVCVPATGECLYTPLNDGDSCTPSPADPSCAFYTCESQVCTKQCVAYTFTGFLPPVQNTPKLNVVLAGLVIPMRFSLSGDQGLSIIPTGYPTSQQIKCASVGTAVNMPTETVSPGETTLYYNQVTDNYIYLWETKLAWTGTCRQFVLKLADGSNHLAYFLFL